MNANVDLLGANGQAQGDVANQLLANGKLNLGSMRPFIGDDGRSYMTVYRGGNPKSPDSYVDKPININATLRRDKWKQLDEALLVASRYRLGGVEDLVLY